MRFKFYADENFSSVLVNQLRQFGYDVLTVADAGRAGKGLPDPQVLETAISLGRSVLTFNRKDFLGLHHVRESHKGIVLCKDDRNRPEQIQILHQYLLEQETLDNRCIRLLKQNNPRGSKTIFIVQEYVDRKRISLKNTMKL